MLIEGRSGFIFGIDQHRIGCDFGTGGTIERIGQQRTAQSLTLEPIFLS